MDLRAPEAKTPAASAVGGTNPPDVLTRVTERLGSLAPSEQRVGRVILTDPEHAALLTITELAALAATSETTVIRFCRSLGVGSYPKLRVAVAAAAAVAGADLTPGLSTDIDTADDLATLVAKIGAADARAVSDTVAHLDVGELDRAVAAVCQARHIDIYSAAATGFLALDLQQKLVHIGLTAFAWSDPHLALPSACNLTPDDVAIGISHSATTDDTVDALTEARDRGAATVAVTRLDRAPIARVADVVLRTVASETTFRSGPMASRIAGLTLVDCLFLAVAQRRFPETLDALARTRGGGRGRR